MATRPTRRVVARAGALVTVAAVLFGCASAADARGSSLQGASAAPTAPHRAACTNLTKLSHWSLARRAAEVLVTPVESTAVDSVVPAVAAGVGGIVLFGSTAPADLGARLARVRAAAPGGIAPFVMADEEGGGVQRLANLVGALPWPRTLAETRTPAAVAALAEHLATAMRRVGVDMDLAPVLDLASGPGPDATHTDGPRSFSAHASVATTYGLAFARGLRAGGVVPVVKHFPGEGGASANTDDSPASTPPLSALRRADLRPFAAAIRAGVPAVMVGNASVPGLSTTPASLSRAVIDGLLEHELHFHGLVVTDSLSAEAIAATGLGVPQATIRAVGAGADLVLFNADRPVRTTRAIITALVGAVRDHRLSVARLTDAADEVLIAKHVRLCD